MIHFYSSATGVSFELPVGFQIEGEDERSAQYRLTDDDDEGVIALITIQVLAAVEPGAEAQAVATVVEAFAAANGDQIEERLSDVDDCRVHSVALHLPAGTAPPALADSDAVVHFSAVAFGHGIRTITAFAPWADRHTWIDVFDKAVASCRFI